MSNRRTLKQYAALLRGMHGHPVSKPMRGLTIAQANACAEGARAIELALSITCCECGKPELIHTPDCPWRAKDTQIEMSSAKGGVA